MTIQDFLCSPGRAPPVVEAALLNPVFWLVFHELSTWRSHVVCRNFTAILMIWRTWPVPCTSHCTPLLAVLRRWEPVGGAGADTRAAGLGEAHADVVLKVLKLATNAAYTDFLKRNLAACGVMCCRAEVRLGA